MEAFSIFDQTHPMWAKKVIPITSSVSSNRITGRLLVQLDRKIPVATIMRRARMKGLTLISSKNLSQAPAPYDALIFEQLHIAVISEHTVPRLAVLDTGFDFTHPDFTGRTIRSRDPD